MHAPCVAQVVTRITIYGRYVDVDCDLHTSSVDALAWLFESGLVAVGTLFGYDD